jgi:hypothetical protein
MKLLAMHFGENISFSAVALFLWGCIGALNQRAGLWVCPKGVAAGDEIYYLALV